MRSKKNWPRPRFTVDHYGHKLIDGYTFIGRYKGFPNKVAMVDRVTGQTKVLNSSGGAIVFDNLPANFANITIFGPNDGPYNQEYRLRLDNGVLSYEYAPGYNSSRTIAYDASGQNAVEITVDPSNGSVVYTPIGSL